MTDGSTKVVLTGFMGVGKTTVARHLAYLLRRKRQDLDEFMEKEDGRSIAEIIESDGEDRFREFESGCLEQLLESGAAIISLGGGAWTQESNRRLIKDSGYTSIWLESTFEHCWRNIKFSRNKRPLAENKQDAKKLFLEREKLYCLAEWHFVIRPGNNSFDVAKQIAQEVFGRN